MAHMVETMAYAGELPWHGLGVKVIDDLTQEQMMQKAGVDWSVEKQDLVTKMGSSVKNKQALVRSSDGSVLDIVGKGWNPVQNADAFNFFDAFDARDVLTIAVISSAQRQAGVVVPGDVTVLVSETSEESAG